MSPPAVPPGFWLTDRMRDAFAARHMGRIICAYRVHAWHGKPLSQETVARWAGLGQAQLSRVESGPRLQGLSRLAHWARVLRIPPRLLWFDVAGEPGGSAGLPAGASGPATELEEVSATLRRGFVAIGGSAVAGHALARLDGELDLIHLTLDRGTASEERITHLERVAEEFGARVQEVTPLAVLAPTLAALRSVRTLLEERQPTARQVRLVRVGAMLATVVGEIMFCVGRLRQAGDWYQTAGHAASDAGDRYLADVALGGRAYLATYSSDPRGVLALLAPRLDGLAVPSPAVARLWGLRARAHATLAETADFKRSMERASDCLAHSAPELVRPGIFSFLPGRLASYEATGSVALNDPSGAIDAADQALSLLDPALTTNLATTSLDHASALAQSGEISEACRIATDAILRRARYQFVAVRVYARKFDKLVRAHALPEVRDWRDARAEAHGRTSNIPYAGDTRT